MREACLQALGVPKAAWPLATLTPRDYEALQHIGFYAGDAERLDSTHITLLDGSRVPGLLGPPGGQGIIDATAELAALDNGFELSVFSSTLPSAARLVVYGGRAPDGCLVGVLAWL